MTEIVEDKRALPASRKIVNAKLMTIIPNSRAEHSIYTYSTKVDTHFDIKTKGFFNPAYTFLRAGDVIRVFRFEKEVLVTYYEFIVAVVDTTVTKTVEVALLKEHNVQKALIK